MRAMVRSDAVGGAELAEYREFWGRAVENGALDDAVRAAADVSAGWWARGAAACGLLDAEALDRAHGAAVFEALVFGLLAGDDVAGARTAARGLLASGAGADVVERVDGWRAICGVSRASFWGGADVPLEDEADVRAWVTPVNGYGRVGVLVRLTPRRGPADVCTSVSAQVGVVEGVGVELVGRLFPVAESEEQVRDMLRFGAMEVPGREGAALIATAAAATRRASPAAALVARFAGRLPRIERGPVPSAAEARALVQTNEHVSTWRIDAVDLRGRDPDGPIERLARVADRPALRERGVAMARTAAWWHHWRGHTETARAFAALAADAERHWRASRLLRALLEGSRSFVPLRASIAPAAPEELRLARIHPDDLESYGDSLIAALVVSPEGAVRRAEGSPLAWIRVVLMYSLGVYGVTPLAWSPSTLGDLLLTTLPQQATATSRDVPELLGDLRALVAFMGRQWGLAQAGALLDVLGEWIEPVLRTELDDRALWMPHKASLVAAREAGLLNDPEALLQAMDARGPIVAEA